MVSSVSISCGLVDHPPTLIDMKLASCTSSARNGFAWPRSDFVTCQRSIHKSTWPLFYAGRYNVHNLIPELHVILALALRSGFSSVSGSSLASPTRKKQLDPETQSYCIGSSLPPVHEILGCTTARMHTRSVTALVCSC